MLSNSIKFTKEGYVRLNIQYQPPEIAGCEAHLEIRITDSGIGMNSDQAGSLFKPYYQADVNTSRKFGGTGLGLSIAKQLAQLMGGDIELVKSAPGAGCEFLVRLLVGVSEADFPVLNVSHITEARKNLLKDQHALQGRRILVVDDSADNLVLVSRIISKVGGLVDTAEDGIEGVQKATHNNYDVVLMDLEMPKMDGLEALKQIRQSGIKTHIIALTGHAYADDRIRCIDAGFDDHVCKPIDKGILLQSLITQLPKHATSLHA